MSTMQAVKQDTLDWVNMIRTEYGLPALTQLPLGLRGAADMCVVSCALEGCGQTVVTTLHSVSIVVVNAVYGYDVHERVVPSTVRQFIDGFDHECFPELDADVRVTESVSSLASLRWARRQALFSAVASVVLAVTDVARSSFQALFSAEQQKPELVAA